MAIQTLFKNKFAEVTFDHEKNVYFQYFESTKRHVNGGL